MSDKSQEKTSWSGHGERDKVREDASRAASKTGVSILAASTEPSRRGRNMPTEALDTITQELISASKSNNSQYFYEIVRDVVLPANYSITNDTYHAGKPMLSFADMDYVVSAYGGKEKFVADARRLLSVRGLDYILTGLLLKVSHGKLWPEHIATQKRVAKSLEAQRALQKYFLIPGAEIVSGVAVLKIADEWLKTAKAFYSRLAEDLADAGYPNLAATVQTLNDLLIPGSAPELVVMLIPIGRMGGLASIVLRRIGRSSPRLAAAANRARVLLNKDLSPPIRKMVNRFTKSGDQYELVRLVIVEENMISIVPSHVVLKGSKAPLAGEFAGAMTSKMLKSIDDILRVPSGAKTRFQKTLIDGEEFVIQSRRGVALRRRTGGRVSNAQGTAEDAGYASLPNQNWAHLLPEILGGEDAVFNFVRANARVNKSYAGLIDYLRDKNLAGATLDIEVVFRSVDDVINRHAERIIWKVNWPDKRPFMLDIRGPEIPRDLTYMQALNAVIKQADRIAKKQLTTAEEGWKRLINALID